MNNSISDLFIKEAIKTEAPITPELISRLTEDRTIRLLHASMGMVTEAGELLDALKKFIFYGKDLDLVNIKEEGGDSQWYFALLLDELNYSYEEIWALVIKKLQARYKGKFNEEGAVNRDLNNEREILEEGLHTITENVVDGVKMEIVEDDVHFHLSGRHTLCGVCVEHRSVTISNSLKDVTCSICIQSAKVNYGK